MVNGTYKYHICVRNSVRTKIDIERGGDLHERVKEYARENGIRHPRAYAELLEQGLDVARKTDTDQL